MKIKDTFVNQRTNNIYDIVIIFRSPLSPIRREKTKTYLYLSIVTLKWFGIFSTITHLHCLHCSFLKFLFIDLFIYQCIWQNRNYEFLHLYLSIIHIYIYVYIYLSIFYMSLYDFLLYYIYKYNINII